MTHASFVGFYPQFSSFTPGVVLNEYIEQANARFSDFDEDAEEARRLYVAHKLTLYAMGCPEAASPMMSALATAGGSSRQEVSSKKVGEVSVTYADRQSAAAGTYTGLNDLKETVFGEQLLSLLRLYGFGRYIP